MKKQELERENAFLKYLLSSIAEVVKCDFYTAEEIELFRTVVNIRFYTEDYEKFLVEGKLPVSKGLY